jgi:hypothetical protein
VRRKEDFSQKEEKTMTKEIIFKLTLRSKIGDYAYQAQLLAFMKPNGW